MLNKKVIVLILFLIAFILYFFQRNIFSTLKLFGIMPNILIIYILFLGLYTNSKVSISIGIFLGFLLDTIYGKCIGISSMMFCILAYVAAYFDKNFSKDNKITIIIMCIGATFVYELGCYIINSVVFNFEIEFLFFLKKVLIENLYNTLLLIIIYPIFKKLGYILDRKFKHTNLLTKYF